MVQVGVSVVVASVLAVSTPAVPKLRLLVAMLQVVGTVAVTLKVVVVAGPEQFTVMLASIPLKALR